MRGRLQTHTILARALRFALIVALAVVGGIAVRVQAADPSRSTQGPLNVVFMLADDLGWGELGCYGQKRIPTPNLDRLASQGMRFTQHYSGAPVCAPSRCVLMTGKHLGHAEIRSNMPARRLLPQFEEGQYPISQEAVTLGDLFHRAGYATAAIGKWGLGPVGSTGDPNRHGFDLFFGYNCQSVAHSYYPPHLWRNQERIVINRKPIPGHQKQPEGPVRMEDYIGEQYAPDLMIAEALKFIEQNAHRPFFLYLPFIEPHVAMHPPIERVNLFPEEWDTQVYRGECNYLPHPRPRAAYAAMIHELDSYVGQVLQALERAGIADKTLVIFSSDNGTTLPHAGSDHFHVGGVDAEFFQSTAGLRGWKGSVYEGGIRVPLIVRLPGRIPPGTVNTTASYFADWLPTLCQAAGLQCPPDIDGDSLWPLLTGEGEFQRRKAMVWVFPESGGQVAVRIGDWKVVRRNLKSRTPGPWELYNLASDPGEKTNLADQHPEIILQAKEILRQETSDNPVFPLDLHLENG